MEACKKGRPTGGQHYLFEFLLVLVVFCLRQDRVQCENTGLRISVRQYLVHYISTYGYPVAFWQLSKYRFRNPTCS